MKIKMNYGKIMSDKIIWFNRNIENILVIHKKKSLNKLCENVFM